MYTAFQVYIIHNFACAYISDYILGEITQICKDLNIECLCVQCSMESGNSLVKQFHFSEEDSSDEPEVYTQNTERLVGILSEMEKDSMERDNLSEEGDPAEKEKSSDIPAKKEKSDVPKRLGVHTRSHTRASCAS